MLHDACRADRFGRLKHLFPGGGHRLADLIKDILAHKQMLGIGHERDCHDFAVNADHLVLIKARPVLFDKIIQRPDKIIVDERDNRRIGDNRAGVLRRVRGQRRHRNLIMLGCVVLVERDTVSGTCFSRAHHRMKCRKIISKHADIAACDIALGECRPGSQAERCSHRD